LAFVKNLSIKTIKKFTTYDEKKQKLIEKSEKINKSYITIKDNVDDINDVY
jgi:hypothetical protein